MTAPAEDIFQTIAGAISSGLPYPMWVHLRTPSGGYHKHYLDIRLEPAVVDALPEWAEWLGIGEVAVQEPFESGDQWLRAHKAFGLWQGWTVELFAYLPVEPTGGAS